MQWLAVVSAKHYYDSGAGHVRATTFTAENETRAVDAAILAFYHAGHPVQNGESLNVVPLPQNGYVVEFATE